MDDLEHRIDRELTALPRPTAPGTLLPRVLAAVAAAETRRWHSRTWTTWPREFQVGSAALLALVVAGVWRAIPIGQPWIDAIAWAGASHAWTGLADLADWARQASTIGRVAFEVVLEPVAVYFLALAVAVSLLCAVLWTAVNRVALGGAVRS